MELWNVRLQENIQREVRFRILGCQAQMRSFEFFYGLNLGYRLYSISNNLSKTLQAENMSAIDVDHNSRQRGFISVV